MTEIVGLTTVSVSAFFSGLFTGVWLAHRHAEAPKEKATP